MATEQEALEIFRQAKAEGDTATATRALEVVKSLRQGTQLAPAAPVEEPERGFLDIVTGRDITTPEIESLREPAQFLEEEVGVFDTRTFNTELGLLASFNPEDQIGILQQQFPEAVIETDANGITTFEIEGKRGVLNAPGFSKSDLTSGVAQALSFVPAARIAALGSTLLKKIGIGAATGAATQSAIEGGQVALGGQVDPLDIAIAGAAPAIAEPLIAAGRAAAPLISAGVKSAAQRVGIGAEKAAPAITEQVQAATSGVLRSQPTRGVAESVAPDQSIVDSLTELGFSPESVPPEIVSASPEFRRLAGAARSVAGGESETAFRQFLGNLSERAKVVTANIDNVDVVNADVEEALIDDVVRAKDIEKGLYGQVDELAKSRLGTTPVDTSIIVQSAKDALEAVGGDKSQLTAAQKLVFDTFIDPKGGQRPFTFQGLSNLRIRLNQESSKAFKGFADASSAETKNIARMVSETQRRAADAAGFGEVMADALSSTGAKKQAQEAQKLLIGRELDKSLSGVLEVKISQLASKGKIAEFNKVVKAIPEDIRGETVNAFIFNKLINQSKPGARVDTAKFSAFFNQLEKKPQAKNLLMSFLSPNDRKLFNSFGKISSAVNIAGEDALKTGAIQSTATGFETSSKILGAIARGSALMGLGPGPAAGAAVGSTVLRSKANPTLKAAASELLASDKFRKHLANVIYELPGEQASGAALTKTPAWAKWVSGQDEVTRRLLATQGLKGLATQQTEDSE